MTNCKSWLVIFIKNISFYYHKANIEFLHLTRLQSLLDRLGLVVKLSGLLPLEPVMEIMRNVQKWKLF